MSALLVRNFVFGIEDSLVSTVGLLSGVAVAAVPRETIILIGVVLILVEAFSMAVGSFLSEQSTEEYVRQGAMSYRGSLAGGIIGLGLILSGGFIALRSQGGRAAGIFSRFVQSRKRMTAPRLL